MTRRADETGSAVALGGSAIVLTLALLVALADAAAYLAAASRAQTAADAAALAAVQRSDPRAGAPGSPRGGATRVASANGATLLSCDCAPGARHVRVTVEVPVTAVAVTRVAARTLVATASAELVPCANCPEPGGAPPAGVRSITERGRDPAVRPAAVRPPAPP